jgi:SAM-dependent methyltransferase
MCEIREVIATQPGAYINRPRLSYRTAQTATTAGGEVSYPWQPPTANDRSIVAAVSAADVNRADGDVVTWHRGLIAVWWAKFNLDGPEIGFFRRFLQSDEPALDAACGTGRLLVPWIAAGFDVDGVDVSADMIAACREAAAGVGQTPALYVQPLHQLDLPRTYRTIVMCGGFGLGTTREQDVVALRRLLDHLRPGGTLAFDYEVEPFDADQWRRWQPQERDTSQPEPNDRRDAGDGFHYALRHRFTEVDVDRRRLTHEMHAWQWRGDELVAHETHCLVSNVYTSGQIVQALTAVGLTGVRVVGGYHGGPPTGNDRFLVFVAHAPPPP